MSLRCCWRAAIITLGGAARLNTASRNTSPARARNGLCSKSRSKCWHALLVTRGSKISSIAHEQIRLGAGEGWSLVPAGSRRAARRSDAGDGSPEASTRSVQRACCAGRRGVLRLAGHGSGRRACTSPAWRARGAGRARDDRDHARQSRWRPLRLARRSTEHAGGARMHQARLQMHLRGYATRSHRAHLRVAAGSGTCTLTESEVARNRAPMTKLSGVRHGKREF